jgi:hypothetical protein
MSSPQPERNKVVISYRHDSSEYMNRFLDLSNRLRGEGIDCEIDQYEESPEDGRPRWTESRICPFTQTFCPPRLAH